MVPSPAILLSSSPSFVHILLIFNRLSRFLHKWSNLRPIPPSGMQSLSLLQNQSPRLPRVSNLNLIRRSNPLLPHSIALSRLTLRSITASFKKSTSDFTKTRRAFTRSTLRAGHGRPPLHALLKMLIHKYVMAPGQIIHIRQLKPLSLSGFGSFCQPSRWKDAAHITPPSTNH